MSSEECDHNGHVVKDPWRFVCVHCGIGMCTDCGTTPSHEDSQNGYCRRCGEKGGHRYSFRTMIDHDKLRTLVGREMAESILKTCRDE